MSFRSILQRKEGMAKLRKSRKKKTKTKDGKSIIVYETRVKESDGQKTEIKIGESGKFIEIQGD